MAQANKMSDREFSALIEELSGQCYGADDQGTLQDERANAIARYNTELWGDEVEGRSALVSSVVRDTVEEAIPQLLRIFLGGDEVVQFDPVSADDEPSAEIESKYINHIITERNPAFEIFSTWFRDGLLQKNGYLIAYPEEKTDISVESYYGLPEDALGLLMQDGQSQIVNQSSYPGPMGILYDVKIRRTAPRKKICIENVPPEEIRVHVTTRSVQPSQSIYTEYRRNLTLSEIRQMGYQVEDADARVDGEDSTSVEYVVRDRFGTSVYTEDASGSDPATQRALFRMIWIRADRDGDGIAELRRVVKINDKIVFEEETDLVPIAALTPVIQPHRHIGYGYYDFLKEIESAATAMLRAYFDNVYLANNGRYGVNVNAVNIDDMLVSKPGGLVRVNGEPGANIFPLQHSSNGSTALEALQYLENWKKQATGVMSDAQSLSSDVLSKAPMGSIAQVISVWQARVEGVARCFAETGVKELFRIVHALTMKHGDQADKAKIGGAWVAVDPREWFKREHLTVTVGLGTGSKESKIAFLQQLGMQQAQAIPLGIATPKNVYESAMELVKEMGYKDGDRFWTDPEKNPPPQPKKDPLVEAEEVKGQIALQKAQMDGQAKSAELAQKSQQEAQQAAMDAQLKEREAQVQAQLEKFKARLEAETQKEIAIINARVELEKEQIKAQYSVQAAKAGNPNGHPASDDDFIEQDRESKEEMRATLAQLAQLVSQLAEDVKAPKEVEVLRGPDGRATGFRRGGVVHNILRGPDGRAMGVQ